MFEHVEIALKYKLGDTKKDLDKAFSNLCSINFRLMNMNDDNEIDL